MKTTGKNQRLIDIAIRQIKDDINDGDVTALEVLLWRLSQKKLFHFLSEDLQIEYKKKEKAYDNFIKNWGQTHAEICTELGYDIEGSDELLMEDYFWVVTLMKWFPKCSSMYTDEEQEIADLMYYI
jgi:hypothetical protein